MGREEGGQVRENGMEGWEEVMGQALVMSNREDLTHSSHSSLITQTIYSAQ